MSLPKKTTVNVIPGMPYHDAPVAIEWLWFFAGLSERPPD
jgi:hypothetical protein